MATKKKAEKVSETIASRGSLSHDGEGGPGVKKGVNLLSIVKKLSDKRKKMKGTEEKGEKEDKKESKKEEDMEDSEE